MEKKREYCLTQISLFHATHRVSVKSECERTATQDYHDKNSEQSDIAKPEKFS
jgi:hypothetical protein